MKKLLLSFLLVAGTVTVLPAQWVDPISAETIFNYPKPGQSTATFTFLLQGRSYIQLELSHISQVEHLPDLDSLIRVAASMLLPLKDSLQSDGMVRRVDIALNDNVPKIRFIAHPELSNSFTVKDGELMQLKVNLDTVRIIGHSHSNVTFTYVQDGKRVSRMAEPNFVLTVYVNEAGNINSIPAGTMQSFVQSLKPHVRRFVNADKFNRGAGKFRASFNRDGNMIWPNKTRYIKDGFTGVDVMVGFGMEYVKGATVPFSQLGIQYQRGHPTYANRYMLYLQTENFFSRSTTGNILMDANMFATFQFLQTSTSTDGFQLAGNASFSYLIMRTGTWYEPHSWKLGIPGVAWNRISLLPYLLASKNKPSSIGFKFTINY